MLNRELLQFTRNSGRISPRFVEPTPAELAMAETLLGIYRDAFLHRLPRARLEENLEPFLKAALHGKLFAGLNKIILDHCEFTGAAATDDAPARRQAVFAAAARLMTNLPEDPALFRRMVRQNLPANIDLNNDIYGDLPEFDILCKVPEWNAAELFNIYNTALVQGLLFYSESLDLSLADTEPIVIRKFMRRLKFYRLLAEVKKSSAHEIQLTLSGPAALFGENRKYGLQLAAFFPVILLLKEWKLRAVVKIRDDAAADTLTLSSRRAPLKGYLRRWAACVPEEVTLFLRSFQQENKSWVLAPDAEFPRLANCGTVFPDFSFARVDMPEKVVHIELFHRYYTHNLEERLDFLRSNPDFPLIIGIDRVLLGKGGEKEFTQRYDVSADRVFFYSNYPGVDRVGKMLEKAFIRMSSKLL